MTAIGGILGILLYEVFYRMRCAGIVQGSFVEHLPNWELFYAALGLVLGAIGCRAFRKGGFSCSRTC